MIGKIVTVNGVKKIVPLTAEARAGNPVSTIIAIYSNLVPSGYLPCNGVQFDETQFPALYAILGDNHTPDLRECALVGAGQNATDTIATHDTYNVGEFKDDQFQTHQHAYLEYDANYKVTYSGDSGNDYGIPINSRSYNANKQLKAGGTAVGRAGTTTHGKQKGVNYCIKATAGLDESDADYVLGVLAPVDEVTVDNMHSVTSNAVAEALGYLLWENPNSTQSFPAQSITFDKAIPYGYSKILVEARHWDSSSLRFLTLVSKEYAGFLSTIWSDSSGNFSTLTRRVEATSDSGCTFGDCRSTLNYNAPSVTNWGAIPTRIWAIK